MRRLVTALALLAAAICAAAPASALTPGQRVAVMGGGYDVAAADYFARLTALGCRIPGAFFKRAVSDYVKAEKTAGNWNTQDLAYITMFDACVAKVNLAQPSLYTATVAASCVIGIATGLDGDGSSCVVDSGVQEGQLVRLTQNNAHVGAVQVGTSSGTFGCITSTPHIILSLIANKATRLTSTGSITDTAGGGAGYHYGDRTSSTAITTGKNGVAQQAGVSSTSSGSPVAANLSICQSGGTFCSSSAHIFFAEVGAAIPDEASHYANLRKMLVALGAQGL